MHSYQSRRRFLATTVLLGAAAGAGCSGNNSDGDDNPEEDSTDADSTSTGGGASGNGSQSGAGQTSSGSVAFDLGMSVSSFGELTGFDRLVVRFEAFELRSEDGTAVRREGNGQEFDLVQSTDGRIDLLTTNMPAGEYTEAACFLPVVDAVRTDGDGSATFENVDPLTFSVASGGPFEMMADGDVGFTIVLSVQRGYSGADWRFNGGTRVTQ